MAFRGAVGVAFWRGQASCNELPATSGMPRPDLAEIQHGIGRIQPDHILDLGAHGIGFGGGRSILFKDGDNLVVGIERGIDIGQCLRFDTLDASTTSKDPSTACMERDTS